MSKVSPEEVKDVKTNQPNTSNQPIVLTTSQPKKIQIPSSYANSKLLSK